MLRSAASVLTRLVVPANLGRTNIRTFASAFEQAQEKLNTLKEDPGPDVKLKLYGLFKQATKGDVTGKRPGPVDFVGRAKYDAWAKLKGTTKDDAEKKYAETVDDLLKG